MMLGPKTTCTLNKRTDTVDSSGSYVTTWTLVQTIDGVLLPYKADEAIKYNKETVVADSRLFVDSEAFSSTANEAELKAKAQIVVGSSTYDIIEVLNYNTGIGAHYEVMMREVK